MATNIEDHESIERNIRAIHFALVRRAKPLLQDIGLSTPRFQLLLAIHRNGPLNMSELHQFTHVTNSTVTTLVDGLESAGFAERFRTGSDRRRVFVRVTAAGEEVIATVRARRSDWLKQAMTGFTPHDSAMIATTLQTISERLTQIDEEQASCKR